MPEITIDRIKSIKSFPSLIKYLRDDLDWPLDAEDVEDLTFEYEPEELGLDAKAAVKVREIKQLRPFTIDQPWGIFYISFEPKRLPVVVLRRILRALVVKKRADADAAQRAAWNLHDLLFISAYGEFEDRTITFAHFSDDEESLLPTLRVIGWDDQDTPLHLAHCMWELGKLQFDEALDTESWRKRWSSAFTLRHREVITTSRELAVRLADLAKRIRRRANAVLAVESDLGPLRKLHKAFQETLIHDLSEDDFADMYAQTIAYGLFSARCSRPAGLIAENIVDMVPVTNPFLQELLATFLTVGGRKADIDFDELGINEVVELLREANMEAVLRDFGDRNPLEDPVIHFYELFLKEYDPKKRIRRGVFFTPRPVVSFIVRSVDEILRAEFGLEDGLADTTTWGKMAERYEDLEIPEGATPDQAFVQILDPATGTGTFLVEVIDLIHKRMTEKWESEGHGATKIEQLWNDYVPNHLLPRLYGYELMMAPYAIAHMKIGLKLYETGYHFGSDQRARVYLTNSLEPPQDFSGTLAFAIPALAHEAEAVNAIKQDQRFTVVIGNPPYANFGGLNKIPFILELLKDYKRDLKEKKLNLDDDFIKFIRFSHHLLDMSGQGVFGMITNNTYLDGITHRRMRDVLLEAFNQIRVIDLHGSSSKREECPDGSKDKNVFDIQQGVGISLFSKTPKAPKNGEVLHKDVWGTRAHKYEWCQSHDLDSTEWDYLCPSAEHYFFVPKDLRLQEEYFQWPGLVEVFEVNGPGVKTERDRVSIHWSHSDARVAVEAFRQEGDGAIRDRFSLGPDSRDWKVDNAKADVMEHVGEQYFRKILYRPFDQRHTWYSGRTRGFIGTPGYPVMRHMRQDGAIGLLAMRQYEYNVPEYCYFLATRMLTECRIFISNRGIANCFPLYIFGGGDAFQFDELAVSPSPNLNRAFLKRLSSALNCRPTDPFGLPEDVTARTVFDYAYGLFHSPCYRKRYAELLKIDFPRLPLTSNLSLFHALAELGGELAALHLMESSKLDNHITTPVGLGEFRVEKVSYSDETVWVDKAKTRGFRGVPEEVWNFHIGGYQVCEKWLKDRQAKGGKNPRPGRVLTAEDIDHYQKIVVALNETIHLMAEIDEVIDEHGGWPDAFQGRDSS